MISEKKKEFVNRLKGVNYLLSKVIQARDYIKKHHIVIKELNEINSMDNFNEIAMLRSQFHNNMTVLITRLFNLCVNKVDEKYNILKFHECLNFHYKKVIEIPDTDLKTLDEVICRLKSKSEIIEKIDKQRNRFYAHLSFKKENSNQIEWEDVYNLIDDLCIYVQIVKYNYLNERYLKKENFKYFKDHICYYYDDFVNTVKPDTSIEDISVLLDAYLYYYKKNKAF